MGKEIIIVETEKHLEIRRIPNEKFQSNFVPSHWIIFFTRKWNKYIKSNECEMIAIDDEEFYSHIGEEWEWVDFETGFEFLGKIHLPKGKYVFKEKVEQLLLAYDLKNV